MSNILVTAIGSFSADIVIKKLKEMNSYVIGCDIYPKEWIADAANVDKFYQAPYAMDTDKYIEFIIQICKLNKIEFLIPLTDLEVDVLNKHRKELENVNVILCISDAACIAKCRDKFVLYHYLKECGIQNLILTQKVVEVNIDELVFPVVMKPADGRSSQGLFFVNDAVQMKNIIKSINVSDYIVQAKIDGSIITVDVVRDNEGKCSIAICRKELLRTLNGAGLSVQVFHDEDLENEAKKIADCLGICGCVNFEFIETEGKKRYFLECNPRFSGGVEFSCLAGYDCISNHLRCFTEGQIQEECLIQEMYIARKYEEYITKIIY